MNSKSKIVVIGGGGHAKVIISILKKLDQFEVFGYIDQTDKGAILDIPYLGTDDTASNLFSNNINTAVLGIGQLKDSSLRKKVAEKYQSLGFNFPTILSSDAIINNSTTIGNGTVIMAGVVINVDSQIGEFGIINTSATIDHDCKIGDFTHIAPGVTLSGGVKIGNKCLVGTGSSIIQYIDIPDNTIIGAGSVLIKSIFEQGIYAGNPARRIK